MFKAIAKPFGALMLWLYNWTGNYGVAVILFALVVKLIMLPFQLKSKKSMMRTTRLTPRLKELEKKYGNDKQKYQEETSKLYKEEGVNPMSGCLWSLLPFPILIALYQAIRYPITIMMGVAEELLETGGAIYEKLVELGYNIANYSTASGAANYAQIYESQFITDHLSVFAGISDKLQALDYSFFGLNLGQVPDYKVWNWDWSSPAVWGPMLGLFMIPVISAASSWLSMKLSTNAGAQTADAQQQNKSMALMMPLVSLFICFTMPAVMGIYWIAQSVFATLQDVILNRIFNRQLDIEDADRIERQKLREAELEAKRLETERLKAVGATKTNKNTSKKKQQLAASQKETERKAAEVRAARLARNGGLEEIPESQVGSRRYARGRAYVTDRYTNPEEAGEKTLAAAEESDAYQIEEDMANSASDDVLDQTDEEMVFLELPEAEDLSEAEEADESEMETEQEDEPTGDE